jgi:hypothetical protein
VLGGGIHGSGYQDGFAGHWNTLVPFRRGQSATLDPKDQRPQFFCLRKAAPICMNCIAATGEPFVIPGGDTIWSTGLNNFLRT